MLNSGGVVKKEDVEKIREWRTEIGLTFIQSPTDDVIKEAIHQSGHNFASLIPRMQDEILAVLSSWYFFLSAEQGRIYANVIATSSETERAKLNMLKPVVDALKVKIDAIKKIYDRRIKEYNTKRETD
jgi:hypothetical protein